MTRLVLFAALLASAAPAAAQTSLPDGDDGLDAKGRPLATLSGEQKVAMRFEADLADLARLAATAALVHERTGAFPGTPFALLGSPDAALTQATTLRLSALSVETAGDSLVMRYVPLPTAPYVREDLVVTATVRPDGPGRYAVTHEMRRSEDADDGARALLYGRAGDYRVERGIGRLCIETARVREMENSFTPTPFDGDPFAVGRRYRPDQFSAAPMTLQIHPPGESEPVFFETVVNGAGR